MNMHLVRNMVTLLLILTLANLAASFMASHALRSAQDASQAHTQRVDAIIVQLTALASRLCVEHPAACSADTVAAASRSAQE